MAEGNNVILSCCNLTACYGKNSEHAVLEDVNINVRKKEIVGILGPNGHGKSSILKALLGLLNISQGEVLFNSEKINHLPSEKIVQKGIRLFPQGGRVFSDLTVDENLQVVASCAPSNSKIEKTEAYEWFPDLSPRSGTRAGLLSGGQRQMLSLGMVLLYMQVNKPLIFLLDEPSGSLDPVNRKRLAEVLRKGRDQYNVEMIIAEENAVFAKEVCERFYQFVEPGRIESFE